MNNNPFIQIPKVLFYSDKYKGMNHGARLLYGVLLDKLSDEGVIENNRMSVSMSTEQIRQYFNCAISTASHWVMELERFKLITRRMSHGRFPSKIYLCDADTGEEITPEYYDRKT